MEGATVKQEVNRVYTKPKKSAIAGKKKGPCFRCNREGHFAKDKDCPARSATCNKCHKVGHYASVCKTKQSTQSTRRKRDSDKVQPTVNKVTDNQEYVFIVDDKFKGDTMDVNVGGVMIADMLIDSGATCNIVNEDVWKSLKSQGIKCKTELTSKKLYLYATNKPFKLLGKYHAEAVLADNKTQMEVCVIKGAHGRSLLGRSSAEKLGVLKWVNKQIRLNRHISRTSTDNVLRA
ncbi:uncharacterized protein [Ptychodera flava]|uniref:uncharacterized protein n=1 Tax=Ptychodera flava TaxID=63121 RepID=UPI00396A2BC9